MATIVIKDKNLVPQNIRDGVTILKVTGTYEGGGGTEINNQDKTVDPSTVKQVITADASYTGLGTVTVNEYELDSKTVDPSTVQQVITSDADGLSSVTVNAVTSKIDRNIVAGNIRTGQTILGVTGNFNGPYIWPEYTVDASRGMQLFDFEQLLGAGGIKRLIVNPVDSSIDSNIVAENIKSGVTILGVTGNYVGDSVEINNQTKSVTPRRTLLTVTADAGYTGMDQVNVYGVDASIDSNITPSNIKSGVNILGVTGNYSGGGGSNNRAFPRGKWTDYSQETIIAFAAGFANNTLTGSMRDAGVSLHGKSYPTYSKPYEMTCSTVMVISDEGPVDTSCYNEPFFYVEYETSDRPMSFFLCNCDSDDSTTRYMVGADDVWSGIQVSLDGSTWDSSIDVTGKTTNVYFKNYGVVTFKMVKPNSTKTWYLINNNEMEPMPPMPDPIPCPDCEGTGVDPNTGGTCNTCGGEGVIW